MTLGRSCDLAMSADRPLSDARDSDIWLALRTGIVERPAPVWYGPLNGLHSAAVLCCVAIVAVEIFRGGSIALDG